MPVREGGGEVVGVLQAEMEMLGVCEGLMVAVARAVGVAGEEGEAREVEDGVRVGAGVGVAWGQEVAVALVVWQAVGREEGLEVDVKKKGVGVAVAQGVASGVEDSVFNPVTVALEEGQEVLLAVPMLLSVCVRDAVGLTLFVCVGVAVGLMPVPVAQAEVLAVEEALLSSVTVVRDVGEGEEVVVAVQGGVVEALREGVWQAVGEGERVAVPQVVMEWVSLTVNVASGVCEAVAHVDREAEGVVEKEVVEQPVAEGQRVAVELGVTTPDAVTVAVIVALPVEDAQAEGVGEATGVSEGEGEVLPHMVTLRVPLALCVGELDCDTEWHCVGL